MNAIKLPCGHLKDSVPCHKIQDLGPTCTRGQALVKKDRAYLRYQASVAMRSRCGVVRRPTAHVGKVATAVHFPARNNVDVWSFMSRLVWQVHQPQ